MSPADLVLIRDLAGYVQREAERRARTGRAAQLRLRDDELSALLALLRREVGTDGGARG